MKNPPPRPSSNASLPAMLARATQLHQDNKLAQAEIVYRSVLGAQPRYFEASHFLGILKYQQGNNPAAIKHIGDALKIKPNDANALSDHGAALAAMNSLEEAFASFDRALAVAPTHPDALNGHANVLMRLGRAAEALASFDRLVAIRPEHADAFNNRGVLLTALRRPAEALDSYDRAIALRPAFAEALSNRGDALRDLARFDDALASYDLALAHKPRLASVHNNRGNLLMQLQRPQEALESYDKALSIEHALVEVINNRGVALRDLNRLTDALASFDWAVAIRPDYADALNNRGVTLRDLQRFDEALESFDKALAVRPDYIEALNNRGIELSDLRRSDEALACYDRALALRPDYAEALNNRGALFRSLRRPAEALADFNSVLAIRPAYPEALNNRGGVLKDLQRQEEALASFDAAVALKPDYAEAHDNRGIVLTTLGRLDEAAEAIEEAIRLAPGRVRSYYNLAGTRRLRAGDPHIRAMEDLAQDMSPLSISEQIDLQFALSKAYADTGEHTKSFERQIEGNTLKRALAGYDEAATLDVFERTKAAFTSERVHRRQGLGEPSTVPVFIIGMPRSGTTLVEQILASHPQVFGAGEIGTFGEAVQACVAGPDGAEWTDDDLAQLSAETLRQLGATYVESIRALAPDAGRIVNKMPGNFFFAGAIHLALPEARIIHTRRDPVDTCLSCFSKLFAEDLAYAYDLGELGRYYRAYEALMAHWRTVLPEDAMLEVQYEDVVADLEGQARRIVAYCGLDWDPRCLDFHLTKRTVSTASATQVRQPIYKSSVGRWRVHEPFLGPLLDELGRPPSADDAAGLSASAA